jgi:DNA-binding MarR family transcriptional regulator
LKTIADFDAGIHNPARLMIVYLLSRCKSMDYTQLMGYTELTSGNITTHLTKLAQAGYISVVKSFRGNKPNTSVQLTEKGSQAYLNWGENILKSLPEATKQHLYSSLINTLGVPKHPLLAFRDGYPYLYAEQAHFLLHGYYGRGVSLPPKDESYVW